MKNLLFISLCLIFSVSVYAEQWHQKANFGGTGRHRATGFSIGNKGYIGLGHVNGTGINYSYNDWWQYDPSSDSWTQKANFPIPNYGVIAFSTDTKGYIGGGAALNNEFYEYNPVTNTWSPIAACPISPGDDQVFTVQNKGYVYSGDLLYEYNPANNQWTQKANCPIWFGAWCSAFATYSSGFVKNGSSLYEYKPISNSWTQRANFPGLSYGGGAAFESNEKGFFVCGYIGSLSDVTNEVWQFNPGDNTWTLIGHFPGSSRRFPVAFSINDMGYFGTGTNGINMNDFWQYNPQFAELNELENSSISVFPNPTADVLNFSLADESYQLFDQFKVELYTLDGKHALSEVFTEKTLSVKIDHLEKGTYIYRIINSEKLIANGQVIKN